MEGLIDGRIVHFVDETVGDYNEHLHKPAIVQYVYASGVQEGYAHLQVFEAHPEDNRAVDAYYSALKEPGTWHWIEKA